jgi:lambda repressor-like predicted transcriptional regulator
MEIDPIGMVCHYSKRGNSLSQISQITGLSIDQVKQILRNVTGLTSEQQSIIFDLKQEGRSLEQISQEVGVELDVLLLFLPQDLEPDDYPTFVPTASHPTQLGSSTSEYHGEPAQSNPQFIYSYTGGTDQLFRTNLLTGEQSSHQVPNHVFKISCRWSELPGGTLLITGGCEGNKALEEVVEIDTLRECAVTAQPSMLTARHSHAVVHDAQYVYVLAGILHERYMKRCERFVCVERRWEVLPALPVACSEMSAVQLDHSLYVLGGYADGFLDAVQTLRLDSLTWELMQLTLPHRDYLIPCFKRDTEVFLLLNKTPYSFTPLQIKAVKSVPQTCMSFTSYYSRGTLYTSWLSGVDTLDLAELD